MKRSIIKFYVTILLILVSQLSCTKLRSPPNNTAANHAGFQFPHPSSWKDGHMAYYANSENRKSSGINNCMGCHSETKAVTKLNISCGETCHQSRPESQPASTPSSKEDIVCKNCHINQFGSKFMHYPTATGQCQICHTIPDEHIKTGRRDGVTTDTSKEGCYRCHNEVDTERYRHTALDQRQGSCTICHSSHGSDLRPLLRTNMNAMCVTCHRDKNIVHASLQAVGSKTHDCTGCHKPHSSDLQKLLKKPADQLCSSCHDKDIESKNADGETIIIGNIMKKVAAPFPHAPATQTCSHCHAFHPTAHEKQLTQSISLKSFNKYSDQPNTYQLCFSCHKKSLLSQVISKEDTKFRNDTIVGGTILRKNLHYFHVVNSREGNEPEQNGRSCLICHDSHGADQHHDIKKSWMMKKFDMAIEYHPLPNGGSCDRTCHNNRTYERKD